MSAYEDNLERMRAHLARFNADRCPVCHKQNWMFLGTSSEQLFNSYPELQKPSYNPLLTNPMEQLAMFGNSEHARTIRPLVTAKLLCRTCFFIREFAWGPIAEGVGLPKKGAQGG